MENFKFKKSYGQNFLKDNNIIMNIVKNTNIKDNSLVIEIGPGSGSLTNVLSKYAKNDRDSCMSWAPVFGFTDHAKILCKIMIELS